MDTFPFFIFLYVHLVSLIVGFGSVLVTDFFGLLLVSKKVSIQDIHKVAHQTEKLIWLGWSGLVASGLGLILFKGYIDDLTMIKLFFVAMIAINGIFLHSIKNMVEAVGDGPLPGLLKFYIGLSSAVSQLGWWGALTIGFLHRHWSHTISWPDNPFLYIGLIAFTIVFAAVVGKLVFSVKTIRSQRPSQ